MKRSFSNSDGKHPLQQQIATMLGDRVRKPRPFTTSPGPPAKRQKVQNDTDIPPIAAPVPAAPPPPQPSQDEHTSVQSQKRKWRLAEIIKLDREARRLKSMTTAPSFVLVPTDSSVGVEASPSQASTQGVLSVSTTPSSSATTTPRKKRASGVAKKVTFAKEVLEATSALETRSIVPKVNPSGGEAIQYDRDRLPKSHNLLLDVMTSMESALSLLRTRRTSPTVGSIRDIVQKDTKRNFTLRMLSQLAHLVPECVAVLSGRAVTNRHKRPSDNLVVRLDEPHFENNDIKLGTVQQTDGSLTRESVLGDSAARVRRALLHKRLLQHVEEQHRAFLREASLSWDGFSWHPDFDLECDVQDLPAPPLFVEKPPRAKQPLPSILKRDVLKDEVKPVDVDNVTPSTDSVEKKQEEDSAASPNKSEDGSDDDVIPKALLARVRSRQKSRNEHETKVEEERTSNRSLVSKLPCTMDTVSNVLRTEKRSAIGWRQLIIKVAAVHPRKWNKDDVERQLDAIAKIATDWCKKVKLQSSSGGFAFRVISEKAFASARAKVCAADSISLD